MKGVHVQYTKLNLHLKCSMTHELKVGDRIHSGVGEVEGGGGVRGGERPHFDCHTHLQWAKINVITDGWLMV